MKVIGATVIFTPLKPQKDVEAKQPFFTSALKETGFLKTTGAVPGGQSETNTRFL